MNNEETSKLALFEGREIRKSFQNGEWWFSIIDVVEALVGGDRPRKYWSDLKKKLIAEGYFEVSEKIRQLKMVAPDGNLIKHFLGGRPPLGGFWQYHVLRTWFVYCQRQIEMSAFLQSRNVRFTLFAPCYKVAHRTSLGGLPVGMFLQG